MNDSFKDMAQRAENATEGFLTDVQEQFGKTREEAEKVLAVFKKARAVKLCWALGRYELTHGAFWEADVIDRALQV